jgi:hypothetical protein
MNAERFSNKAEAFGAFDDTPLSPAEETRSAVSSLAGTIAAIY